MQLIELAQRLARFAGISHTRFIRTSSKEHHVAVSNLWVRVFLSYIPESTEQVPREFCKRPVTYIRGSTQGGTPSRTKLSSQILKSNHELTQRRGYKLRCLSKQETLWSGRKRKTTNLGYLLSECGFSTIFKPIRKVRQRALLSTQNIANLVVYQRFIHQASAI